MSPRTGRPPKTDNEPKHLRLEIRLSESELDKIQQCADKMAVSKSEAIMKGIDLLSDSLAEN